MSAGPQDAEPGDPRLMRVSAELVREHLVNELLGAALSRRRSQPPPPLPNALEDALEQLGAAGYRIEPSDAARQVAAELARLGYLGRQVEVGRFEAARAPIPWLEELLDQRREGDGGADPAREVARELALAEPDRRPDPDGDAPSWRVPGPGGHVRHYVAMAAAAESSPDGPDGEPAPPAGASPADLKRCWMLGFHLRCCEEAIARGT